MLVWIFQTGEPLHSDSGFPRPMRAINLANSLVARGHTVEIWRNAFYHQEKRHRYSEFQTILVHDQLTIHLIPSIGYKKNIGLLRLIDHAQLSFNLWKLLRSEKFARPNVSLVGYPPIETSWVMMRWLKSQRVPCIIDVKDQWPLLFVEAFPWALRPFAKIVFSPYFWLAKRAMQYATNITSMSEPFLLWALSFSGRSRQKMDVILPLVSASTPLSENQLSEARQWWVHKGVDLSNCHCFTFIGSLSQAFNFSHLKDVAEILKKLHPECLFVICGEGDEKANLSSLFSGMSNVILPGWIDAPKIASLMESTIATIAPYRNTQDFQLSIPNKVLDSFCFGQPVVTALRGEVERLIFDEGVGIVCEDTIDGWLSALCQVLEDVEFRRTMSIRATQLYADRYDADAVYGAYAIHMENLATFHHER